MTKKESRVIKLSILNITGYMTKSYSVHQDEDLTFPILDSDFDNSIM